VALEVVRGEHASRPEITPRFVEEAQIGGQLQHPGIVPVYESGLHVGRPFITRRLIKGRTLAALLERAQAALPR
jgi:serine/threonine-protein kinase